MIDGLSEAGSDWVSSPNTWEQTEGEFRKNYNFYRGGGGGGKQRSEVDKEQF